MWSSGTGLQVVAGPFHLFVPLYPTLLYCVLARMFPQCTAFLLRFHCHIAIARCYHTFAAPLLPQSNTQSVASGLRRFAHENGAQLLFPCSVSAPRRTTAAWLCVPNREWGGAQPATNLWIIDNRCCDRRQRLNGRRSDARATIPLLCNNSAGSLVAMQIHACSAWHCCIIRQKQSFSNEMFQKLVFTTDQFPFRTSRATDSM